MKNINSTNFTFDPDKNYLAKPLSTSGSVSFANRKNFVIARVSKTLSSSITTDDCDSFKPFNLIIHNAADDKIAIPALAEKIINDARSVTPYVVYCDSSDIHKFFPDFEFKYSSPDTSFISIISMNKEDSYENDFVEANTSSDLYHLLEGYRNNEYFDNVVVTIDVNNYWLMMEILKALFSNEDFRMVTEYNKETRRYITKADDDNFFRRNYLNGVDSAVITNYIPNLILHNLENGEYILVKRTLENDNWKYRLESDTKDAILQHIGYDDQVSKKVIIFDSNAYDSLISTDFDTSYDRWIEGIRGAMLDDNIAKVYVDNIDEADWVVGDILKLDGIEYGKDYIPPHSPNSKYNEPVIIDTTEALNKMFDSVRRKIEDIHDRY